jgi:hypothetical protein
MGHLHRPNSDDEFEALIKDAIKLAKRKIALGLLGYLGPEA